MGKKCLQVNLTQPGSFYLFQLEPIPVTPQTNLPPVEAMNVEENGRMKLT